jgi:outer membrane cobalamin receptor
MTRQAPRVSLTVVALLFAVLSTTPAVAQPKGGKGYLDLTLEELLNQPIGVTSARHQSFRESPGIVTVITAQEIADSGARDLIDVLQMVPGFAFGVDVEGVVGLGVRGNWAHEGKVLLLIDDQEFNEPLYGSLQFGNHFPLHSIDRIEIIRGPGSAIYGGYAELAVIRILTRSAEDMNGVSVQGTYGQMADGFGRRTLALSAGGKAGKFRLNLHAFGGQGNRSDQTYTDLFGQDYSMAGNSRLDPLNLNLGLGYKGLELRFLTDRFSTTSRDAYDQVMERPTPVDFDSHFFEARYTGKLGPKLTLIPRFRLKHQTPWHNNDPAPENAVIYYDRQISRYTGGVTLLYTAHDRFSLTAGTEFYRDEASLTHDGAEPLYFNGELSSVDYSNNAAFVEGLASAPVGNFTLGARYSDHSQFGSSFVPRLAFTRVAGRFPREGFGEPGVSRALRGKHRPLATDQTGEDHRAGI